MTPYIAEEVSLAARTTSKSTCPKPPWQPQPPPTRPATSPPIPRRTRLTLRSLPAWPPIWLTCPSPPTKTCLPPPHTPLTRQDILLTHIPAHIPIFSAFTVPQQQPWWTPRRHRRSESSPSSSISSYPLSFCYQYMMIIII